MLQEGVTLARIGATALLVAVTEAILTLIRSPHTPAGTTTLLVSLGLFTTPCQLLSLGGDIVLVTITSWVLNRSLGAPVLLWGPSNDAS
jgi:CBS domain-containing membrane protein